LDPATGLSLLVAPADSSLAARWVAEGQLRGGGLEGFAEAARSQAPNGLLVLGCPLPGQEIEDWGRSFSLVQPDGIQLVGCPGAPSFEESLAVAGRLGLKYERPVFLLPTSSLIDAGEKFGQMIAVGFGNLESETKTRTMEMIGALKTGQFFWSSGALIAARVAAFDAPSEPNALASRTRTASGRKLVALEFKVVPTADWRVIETALVTPLGTRFEIPAPVGPWAHGAWKKAEVSVPRAAGLVRLEVLGVPVNGDGSKKILGTTSWFHLEPPPPVQPESP